MTGLTDSGRRRDRAVESSAFVAACGLLLLLQWKALVLGETTLRHDHLYWGVPLYGFFAESLLEGRLPLWNPFTHGGEPIYLPLFQLRLLDPTAILVPLVGRWLTSDLVQLYAWDRFVRGIVIAVACYLLLRPWARASLTRLSLIPILLFSSVYWSHIRQMALAEQFLVAPLVAFFFFRIVYFRDHRWRNWLAGAFLVGLNCQSYFFSGTAILLAAFCLGLALFKRRLFWRALRAPGVGVRAGASLAIVAVMLLPSAVLLSEANRFVFPPRVIDYEYETKRPNQGPPQFEPRGEIKWTRPLLFPYALTFHVGTFSAIDDFVQLLAPLGSEFARPEGRRWGAPSEAFMYIGMLPFTGALLGLVAGRHPLKRVWLVVLVVMGLLALGPQAGLHAALYWVFPPLWFLRNTHTLAPFFVLALLYFYVLGCNRLLAACRRSLFEPAPPSGPLTGRLPIPGLGRFLGTAILTFVVGLAVLVGARLRFPFTFYVLPLVLAVSAVGYWLRRDLGTRWLFWSLLGGHAGAAAALALRARDRTSILFILVFLVVPIVLWVCWGARSRALPRLGVLLSGVIVVALAVHRAWVLILESPPPEAGIAWGLALAGTGGAVVSIMLLLTARDVFRTGPPRLSRTALLTCLALVLTCDLLAYSGYLKALVEWDRPERFLSVETAPQPARFPVSRVLAPVLPPKQVYPQTIRYLDVFARRPSAFSPLFDSTDSSSPGSGGPVQGSFSGRIDTLLRGERASTFLMPRSYYRLIYSGAPPDALAEILAIDRPLIQFKPMWLWLSEADALRFLRGLSRAPESSDLLTRAVVLELPRGRGREASDRYPALEPSATEPAPFSWRVDAYDYNSLSMTVEASSSGVLYWADGYDPRWRASLDGTRVSVHRANLAFKGIMLPPGRHEVRFEFQPTAIIVSSLVFVGFGFMGAGMAAWAVGSGVRTGSRRLLAGGPRPG